MPAEHNRKPLREERSDSVLLRNCTLVCLDPPSMQEGDLRTGGGVVLERGSALKQRSGDAVIDVGRRIVMPGFVNAHTHLYSALSRGMPPPKAAPKNFLQILKSIWWKVDEALDEETIYHSAIAGAIEAVRCGTTTLVDHHASPNCIPGSLDIIKDALSHVGLRGILCYETTDRGGSKRRDLGLQENERFLVENVHASHFRGLMGAHASFTLENATLMCLGELAELYDSGVHVHVAEDAADVEDARKNRRIDIIERLGKHHILRSKSVLVHGVHLTGRHLSKISRSGAWMVHNPRSNMNNAVGYAPLRRFGPRTALGTDGFPSDMIEEARIGFFRNAESDQRVEFSRMPTLLQNGQRLVSDLFGRTFGTLKPGTPADLIVMDYDPSTPLERRSLHGHVLFGMNSSSVVHVMIAGKWIVWDRHLLTMDEELVLAKARLAARKLWKKVSR